MKTFQEVKTLNRPRLVIEYDTDSQSPRENDNIGFFLTDERNYNSPDGKDNRLYDLMNETADEAENTADHIERIKGAAKEEGMKIVAIYPVYRYEHGGVAYRRGSAKGFDYSNCGFYIITDETLKNTIGKNDKKLIENGIDAELKEYTQWANGEVYRFTLYDEGGEEIDACGGFYDIEDIRENLPEEWKDENLDEYLEL